MAGSGGSTKKMWRADVTAGNIRTEPAAEIVSRHQVFPPATGVFPDGRRVRLGSVVSAAGIRGLVAGWTSDHVVVDPVDSPCVQLRPEQVLTIEDPR